VGLCARERQTYAARKANIQVGKHRGFRLHVISNTHTIETYVVTLDPLHERNRSSQPCTHFREDLEPPVEAGLQLGDALGALGEALRHEQQRDRQLGPPGPWREINKMG